MDRNNELLLRVARLYHVQSETMDAIAHQLGVSRSTVSRLLKEARDRGLVRVSIVDPERPMSRLAAAHLSVGASSIGHWPKRRRNSQESRPTLA